MADQPRGFAGFEALVTDISDLRVRTGPGPWQVMVLLGMAGVAVLRLVGPPGGSHPGMMAPGAHILLPPPEAVRDGTPSAIAAFQGSPPAGPRPGTTAPGGHTALPPAAAVRGETPPAVLAFQGGPLSVPEVRYCLAQGIRIQGADKVVNTAFESEVRRFLALVDDYSARCGNSHFTAGAVAVQQEVNARRAALEREGAALIRSPATGP